MAKGSVSIGTFQGRLRLRWSWRGERYTLAMALTDTPLNRTVAIARAKQIEGDMATGNFDPSLKKYKPDQVNNAIAFTELFKRFIDFKKTQVDTPRTLDKYKGLSKKLQEVFGTKSAISFTYKDVESFKVWYLSQAEPITVKERFSMLKSCWDWGVQKKLITSEIDNPWDVKIVVPPKQKVKPFSLKEIKKILAIFHNTPELLHYADFVEFLLGTGCRIGEAVGLRWRHLSEDCRICWFGEIITRGMERPAKRYCDRTVTLTPRLQAMLLKRRPEDFVVQDLVFTTTEGYAIDDHNFRNRVWKKALQLAGVPYRKPYATRKTVGSHALDQGMSPLLVAEMLGHDVRTLYKNYAANVQGRPILPELLTDDESQT